MLRANFFTVAALMAIACPVTPAFAQQDLSDRLDQASKDLDAKIARCETIDEKRYGDLFVEADRVFRQALKAAQSKVPVDEAHIKNAKKASDLLKRAREAKSHCASGGSSPIEFETKVEPPKIAPVQSKGQYTNPTLSQPPGKDVLARDYTREFGSALERYLQAKKKCDAAAMETAMAEMNAAQAKAEAALKDAEAEGKYKGLKDNPAIDVPKWMNEKRKQAEAGQLGLCPPPAKRALNAFASRILADHNRERAMVASPPLEWDERLAYNAENYAMQLASFGALTHAPREGRGIERENLLQALPSWSTGDMMRVWVNEKRNFVAGIYPAVSRTGRWEDVSHYTQMIWPTTTAIGCGLARGARFSWLVCRYSPGGNKDGKLIPANACPPKATRGGKDKDGEEGEFKLGLEYKFADQKICPMYQDTKVPQPKLPNKEAFPPKK